MGILPFSCPVCIRSAIFIGIIITAIVRILVPEINIIRIITLYVFKIKQDFIIVVQ